MNGNISKVCKFVCLCTLSFVVSLAFAHNDENTITESFDVKPGGSVQEFRMEMDGVTCTFSYACQGGTHEGWQFTISRNEEKTGYECTVERPSGTSYLFFQQFLLDTKNLLVEDVYGESQSGSQLSPEEYLHDKIKNRVSHVDGRFNSQLAKLSLRGTRLKDEL